MFYRNNSEAAILAMERDRTGNYGECYDSYLLRETDHVEDDEDLEDDKWD